MFSRCILCLNGKFDFGMSKKINVLCVKSIYIEHQWRHLYKAQDSFSVHSARRARNSSRVLDFLEPSQRSTCKIWNNFVIRKLMPRPVLFHLSSQIYHNAFVGRVDHVRSSFSWVVNSPYHFDALNAARLHDLGGRVEHPSRGCWCWLVDGMRWFMNTPAICCRDASVCMCILCIQLGPSVRNRWVDSIEQAYHHTP